MQISPIRLSDADYADDDDGRDRREGTEGWGRKGGRELKRVRKKEKRGLVLHGAVQMWENCETSMAFFFNLFSWLLAWWLIPWLIPWLTL